MVLLNQGYVYQKVHRGKTSAHASTIPVIIDIGDLDY